MYLSEIKFSEYMNQPREWNTSPISFEDVNLIVGKNASGKSRLLNVIVGLSQILTRSRTKLFQTGTYEATFRSGSNEYNYTLGLQDYKVVLEQLVVDDVVKLDRSEESVGFIYNESEGKDMEFQSPDDQVVAASRRDALQHPYFEEIFRWANSVRHYKFGSSFGQSHLKTIQQQELEGTSEETAITDPDYLIDLFTQGERKFGKKFRQAIVADMNTLGYECTDVKVMNIDKFLRTKNQILSLAVQEKSLKTPTIQIVMSQGMFRALALIIHVNFMQMRNMGGCILLDDIGEGLDFSRASSLVMMMIERADQHQFQLIMTTNDRFVMNGVDLKYWSILLRDGPHVQVFNQKNSKEAFDEFELIGLNNFDFFSSDFFLGK